MKKMFSKHSRNIIASTGKTALEIAVELYDKNYTNLVMVVGSDRVRDFQRILDSLMYIQMIRLLQELLYLKQRPLLMFNTFLLMQKKINWIVKSLTNPS